MSVMDKKPDWNGLEDIKTAIGQTPPLLFEILGRIAGENSEQGSYARESGPEIIKCINEQLLPRASRQNLTDSSDHDLADAMEIVQYIWFIEQLESRKCPEVSEKASLGFYDSKNQKHIDIRGVSSYTQL